MEGEKELLLLQATARQRPVAKGHGKVGTWGVLSLTAEHLFFCESVTASNLDSKGEVKVALSDVAAHFVTPPTAKLICLKITTDNPSGDEAYDVVDASKKRKTGAEFVFEFAAATERDSFRDLIAQLVPPLRRLKRPKTATPSPPKADKPTAIVVAMMEEEEVSVEVARKRAALLEGNEEARDLYQRLVVSGVITPQEFWHSRQHMMDTEAQRVDTQKQKQSGGRRESVAGEGAGEVRPVAESDTSVQYKLTASDIRRIFTEQPTVKKAFEEWVPLKMTEVQFWTKYFQSKYFHRGHKTASQQGDDGHREGEGEGEGRPLASSGKSSKGGIAGAVAIKREEDVRRKLAGIDLDSDLTRSDETGPNAKRGYGVASEEGETKARDSKKLSLLQKINRHATTALGELEKESRAVASAEGAMGMDIDISTSSLTAKDPITKSSSSSSSAQQHQRAPSVDPLKASEARLAESTLLEELEGREHTNYVALAIQDHRRYFRDTSLVPASTSSSSSSSTRSGASLEEVLARFRTEVEAVRQSDIRRTGAIMGRSGASNVMHELGRLCRTTDKTDQGGSYGLSPAEMKLVINYNERATELLRHFWRCYPLSSRALATKAAKVGAVLEELREEVEAAASKKKAKGRNVPSAAAGEVLQSIVRSLTKAIDMSRDSHLQPPPK